MRKIIALSILMAVLFFHPQLHGQNTALNNLSENLPCVDKEFSLRVVMTVDEESRRPLMSQAELDSIAIKASSFFEPICMSFNICEFEVIPNYSYNDLFTPQRITQMGNVFGYPERINVFVSNNVVGPNCGSSVFGGFDSRRGARIYIELGCGDRPEIQLAKHMGTLFGLLDTNNDGSNELVDRSNCSTTGDNLCSTPADPYGYIRDEMTGLWEMTPDPTLVPYNVGCEFVWETLDDNGEFFTPSTTNIMSQYPCKCEFTLEQFQIMSEAYLASRFKH